MPRISDNIPISNEKLDRRVKLTQADKEKIREEYATGEISIHFLAKKYNVSRRTIQFTLFPERAEKNKRQFAERQKEGRYYDREKHTKHIREHRQYKKELYEKGMLGKED